MIVWVAAFAGLIWVMYMESGKHLKAVQRREIDQMADESRRKQTYMAKLEQRKPKPSRAARWATKSPRLAGRG